MHGSAVRGLANVDGSLLLVVEPLDQRHNRALAWIVHGLSGLDTRPPKSARNPGAMTAFFMR